MNARRRIAMRPFGRRAMHIACHLSATGSLFDLTRLIAWIGFTQIISHGFLNFPPPFLPIFGVAKSYPILPTARNGPSAT